VMAGTETRLRGAIGSGESILLELAFQRDLLPISRPRWKSIRIKVLELMADVLYNPKFPQED